MRVRIVLRNRKTGLYCRDRDQWVSNAYNAMTFRNIIEAEEFCRQRELLGLQVIQQSGFFFRARQYRSSTSPAARREVPVSSAEAVTSA